MRIRKTFVLVFLLSFLIGYISVLPTKKTSLPKKTGKVNFQIKNDIAIFEPLPVTENQIEDKPEILEENNDWENESKFNVKLLEVGEGFHGDQVSAKSGENWLGLFQNNGKFYLKKTKLKVSRVQDVVVDEENEKTGKSVKVENGTNSMLLLKNADFLKEGEITTLFGGNPNRNEIEENIDYLELRVGFNKEFTIGKEKFYLSVKKGVNKKGKKIIALILENKNIKQTLHSNEYFGEDDYLGTLYWAGDLDKDKKPDFYLDLYVHENMVYKNLFLSSKSERNKLVKKVAVFSITGC